LNSPIVGEHFQGFHCWLHPCITEEFFRSKYDEIQQRQIEIHAGIEGLRKKNSKYFEEGIEIFELMKNIKNQYVKADPAQKQRIMKILVSNCELKGVTTRIYWNKPFDILFEMGREKKWGTVIYELRTSLEGIPLANCLREMRQTLYSV